MRIGDDGNIDGYGFDDYTNPDPSKSRRFTFDDPAPGNNTPDPNSPEALAAENAIYGPGGTAMQQPPAPAPMPAPAPSGGSRSPGYITQLIQSGMSPQDAVARYNQEFGTTEAQYYDPSQHGGHATIGLPSSYLTDEDNWANATQRMPEGGGGGGVTSTSGGGGSTSSGNGNSALSAFLMNWLSNAGTGQTADRNALFSRLSQLADQYSKPVTADDPNIKASSDAYHGETARAVQNFRTRAAERAHAQGVGTGSFDAAIGNAEMSAGRAEASNTTSLMNTELQSRRNMLSQTLQQQGAVLSAADQAELQSKIAAIDGLLKGQSNDLTARGQDITSQLGNKGLDITQLLGQGAQDIQKTGVNNQNSQFYDKLGVDNASNETQLDILMRSLGLK
jgi:hypothetical protein